MKKLLINVILAFGVTFSAKPAGAILIEFQPAGQIVEVGDSLDVEIVISGLGPDSVSIFDIDIGFNATVLAFNSAAFGDQLDLFSFGDNVRLVAPGAGTVNLFEFAFDLSGDLDTLQADSFTLAMLTFDTLVAGISPLVLSINALDDAFGDPLPATVEGGRITVVPVPGTLILFSSGLIALVGLGRTGRRA